MSQHYVPTPLELERRPVARVEPASPPKRLRWLAIVGLLVFIGWSWLLRSTLRRTGASRADAERARARLEDLGGLWVKAGQLVATRRDLVPDEVCDELAKLQDRAVGFPFADVRSVIELELGAPLERLFLEFDEAPLAAASVGQVHRARLALGRAEVAVKIRRPFIEAVFQSDFSALSKLAKLLAWARILPNARWDDMVWELHRIMRAELDYRVEASSLRRMKETLRQHEVYVPHVFSELSGLRVLTMEYVRGVPLSDYARVLRVNPTRVANWHLENDFDPEEAGRRLYHTHTRQVFEDNLFHCDLHPGNILLLREGRLALIDFGDVGSIQASSLHSYLRIFSAVARRDYRGVADQFLLLPRELPRVDLERVRSEIVRVMRDWEATSPIRELPYHEKSLTRAMQEIAQVFRRHSIPISWEYLQLNRAEMTLDASLMHLLPSVDYHGMIRDYQKEATARALERSLEGDAILQNAAELFQLLGRPHELLETLRLGSENLQHRTLQLYQGVNSAEHAGAEARCRFLSFLFALLGLLLLASCLQGSWGWSLWGLDLGWVRRTAGSPVIEGLALLVSFYLHRLFLGLARRYAGTKR